jgi:hypothetical protein
MDILTSKINIAAHCSHQKFVKYFKLSSKRNNLKMKMPEILRFHPWFVGVGGMQGNTAT